MPEVEPKPNKEVNLDALVQETWERYKTIAHDEESGGAFEAAGDVVNRFQDKVELALQLISQTKFKPDQMRESTVVWLDLIEAENWDEFFADVARGILVEELATKHAEEFKRLEGN